MSYYQINDFYVGYSHPLDKGECYDNGKTGMFPYKDSALGAFTNNVVGWEMTSDRLHILFDLCSERFIEKIFIDERELPKNENWNYAQLSVMYRREINDSRYYIAGKIIPGKTKSYEIKVNKVVRYLQLDIKRSPWRCYPMPQIKIFGEARKEYKDVITMEKMVEEFKIEPTQIDAYGQALYLNWEGKITDDVMLKQNAEKESQKLRYPKINDLQYDKFGGALNLFHCTPTGFFRTEKHDGIWWFITPEGNPFIMKGVDLVDYQEMSYISPINIKGTDIARSIFQELPDREQFSEAYTEHQNATVVNFLHTNIIRKYGEDYDSKWAEVTKKRLSAWGFNAASKWKKHKKITGIPYIKSLHTGNGKKIRWFLDPYDLDFEKNVDNAIRDIALQLKDDPYLIGYHYGNEAGFDRFVFDELLKSDDTLPLKKAFIEFLNEISDKSVDRKMLSEGEVTFDNINKSIRSAFIQAVAKKYASVVRRTIKKYDPNHLFLGFALTPEWHSTYDYNIGALEYLDVLSFDFYCSSKDEWLKKYAVFDKPMINIEFSFTTSERGLPVIFGQIHCENQKERGEQYAEMLKRSFSIPQFIGSGFFILNDQPLSGRHNGGGEYGECHNFGLVDIADEPYWEFVNEVQKVHQELENIHKNNCGF